MGGASAGAGGLPEDAAFDSSLQDASEDHAPANEDATRDAPAPIDANAADVASVRDAAADIASVQDSAPSDALLMMKCPPLEPNPASACGGDLDCTYGTHPQPACRREYVCSSLHWSTMPGCPDPSKCESEPAPSPMLDAPCAKPGNDCVWTSGLYCRCISTQEGGSAAWDCYPPPSGCPPTPPNKGQACDLTAKTCDYGTCRLGTRVITSCVGAIVRWSIPACP